MNRCRCGSPMHLSNGVWFCVNCDRPREVDELTRHREAKEAEQARKRIAEIGVMAYLRERVEGSR